MLGQVNFNTEENESRSVCLIIWTKLNYNRIKNFNKKSDPEIARHNVMSILQLISTGKSFLNKTLITQKRK